MLDAMYVHRVPLVPRDTPHDTDVSSAPVLDRSNRLMNVISLYRTTIYFVLLVYFSPASKIHTL